MKKKAKKERPTFNHDRGDSPIDPCEHCASLMTDDDLREALKNAQATVKDLRRRVTEATERVNIAAGKEVDAIQHQRWAEEESARSLEAHSKREAALKEEIRTLRTGCDPQAQAQVRSLESQLGQLREQMETRAIALKKATADAAETESRLETQRKLTIEWRDRWDAMKKEVAEGQRHVRELTAALDRANGRLHAYYAVLHAEMNGRKVEVEAEQDIPF